MFDKITKEVDLLDAATHNVRSTNTDKLLLTYSTEQSPSWEANSKLCR
jgi:hypothetical protein